MNHPKEETFFEGKDFKNNPFRALMPEFYPVEYQQYINEETNLLKEKLQGDNKILEAGVGIGRIIPDIAPLVREFVGIDNADRMLNESSMKAKEFSNVKIVKGEIEEVGKLFPNGYFDFSLCIRNTLGNLNNEILALKSLKKVTKESIFITVYKKGTIENRKSRYKKVGIEIDNVDVEKEIFFSKSGLVSKSFHIADLEKLAFDSGLKIVDIKILNGLMLWVEMRSHYAIQ